MVVSFVDKGTQGCHMQTKARRVDNPFKIS